MSKRKRNRAKAIATINTALGKAYPYLKVRKSVGGYILNQLIKGGFTNNTIQITAEEVREDVKNAAFACKTDDEMLFDLTGPDPRPKLRPDIHYLSTLNGAYGEVPCGLEQEGVPVTVNDFEVTCDTCNKWLKKPANPKGT